MTPHEAATPIKSARSSSKSERWLASGKWRGSKLEEFFLSADWILQPCQEFTKRSKIAPLLISQSLITISCEVGGQTQQRYINHLKPLNVFKNLYFLRGKKAKSWKGFFTRIFIVKEKRFFFCRMEDFIDGFVQYLLILYYY